MEDLDKTMKLRAFSPAAKREAAQEIPAKDIGLALELEKKTAQLEEERKKVIDALNIVERVRESLRQEQAKTADLMARLNAIESKGTVVEARITVAEAKAAEAEVKIKELTEALQKISMIATAASQS